MLLAAGPLGEPGARRYYPGLSILRCEPDVALRLKGQDQAVQAGVFELVALLWMLPARRDPLHPDDVPAAD